MNSLPLRSLVAGLWVAGFNLPAATPLATGHADVGIGYEGGFDLHVHDGENDIEYSPADALLVVGSQSLQFSTGGSFAFLGPVGTPVWVLPQAENPDLLFLGLGTEELIPSEWTGNITLTLTSVSGPGQFYLWTVNPFGTPSVQMDSANGVSAADNTTQLPGSHGHYNWGFSALGTYGISFEASGLHVADGPQNSGPVVYHFEVVPEPGSLALGLFGLGAFGLLLRWRKA